MDLLPSFFYLEQLDIDLQPEYSAFPDLEQHNFQESILLTSTPLQSSDSLSGKTHDESNKGMKTSTLTLYHHDIDGEHTTDHNMKRKLVHRNVERQRRQDMASLYKSLLANLPTQYHKGKRTMSDHMHEAVKYIKLMQTYIGELEKKREKLNDMISSSGSPDDKFDQSGVCVTVQSCKKGTVVTVISPMGGGMPLSRILNLLIEQGLTTVSCISCKANDRLIHTIESEVSDGRSIDPTDLQRRLVDFITYYL